MRNLKKLLAVVVAICVLATFTVPAFAADTATTAAKTDADICKTLGVVKGTGTDGVTADYLASAPDRVQAAIMFLRLKGLEDTAKAFTGTDNFSDVEGLNDTNKAILAYLKANPNLGFEGVGDNKFDIVTKMTAKAYYKVLLVALGYTYGTDFTWDNVLSFAASKGLTKLIDNEKFTVNDLCVGTVEALKATVKGGTDTLITKLVDGGSITAKAATDSGLYNATAKALEITSATADTLKTAKFVFNKELDSDTVNTDNFTGPTLKKVVLLDDKKTVIVVLKDAKSEQSKTEDITVKNVKSTDGTTIAEVKKTVTFVDNTIPVISGAVAKNAKTIVISASEPMKAENLYTVIFDDIKIDGTAVIAASSTVDYGKNTVTLNLASTLATGSHKIEIAKMTDFANYTAVTQTYSFDVAADTVAPEIASGKVNNPNQIEVTFNEDVDRNYQGSFKINGEDAKAKDQDDENAAKFTLDLTTALSIGATVEINVKYKDQKDVVGNTTAEKTFTFKVADDTTLPTVTASVGDANKITLTFSKDVLKAGHMKVYKDDGTSQIGGEINLANTADVTWDSATVAKVDNDAGGIDLNNTDAKDIKIKIYDIKDATVRANAMAETVIALKAVDSKKPTVKSFYTVKSNGTDVADDTMTVYFSEAMNADTLKNLSNYNVVTASAVSYTALKSFAAYSDVSIKEVASDNKSVTIKAKNIVAAANNTGSALGIRIDAVKDIAGNMMDSTIISEYVTTPFTVSTASAVAVNKIEITFSNSDLASCAPGTFVLRGEAGATTVAATIIKTELDGATVTATLDRDLNSAFTYKLDVLSKALAKNAFGDEMTTAGGIFDNGSGGYQFGNIIDKVKPTVKAFTATVGGIIVEFSEAITTSEAQFATELTLKKGDDPVTVTAGSIVYADNSDASVTSLISSGVAHKYLLIKDLYNYKDYTIQLYPRGITVDAGGNWFVESERKTLTIK